MCAERLCVCVCLSLHVLEHTCTKGVRVWQGERKRERAGVPPFCCKEVHQLGTVGGGLCTWGKAIGSKEEGFKDRQVCKISVIRWFLQWRTADVIQFLQTLVNLGMQSSWSALRFRSFFQAASPHWALSSPTFVRLQPGASLWNLCCHRRNFLISFAQNAL